ncbi:glycosyltransferase [Curtobacterium ammoniigenes]|uniref:glycosyltransferase n=1 Tax=Curtobacterium ammoniigenes TaxID=395387 RepID=UPI00082F9C75|nr:glycosyltransferase [Curtobacterium ammoniigenes]
MDASVIVIDWHQPVLTRRALDAILGQRTEWRFEVVLVVNDADDETVSAYRVDYPAIRLVTSRANTGFAGGVTLGLAAADGAIAVLVNNDAVPDHGFLERGRIMLEASGPRVAALAATAVLEGSFRRVPSGGTADAHDLVAPGGVRWRRATALAAADGGEANLQADSDPAALRADGGEASLRGPSVGESLINGTGVVLDRTGNGRDRDWLAPVEGPRETTPLFGFSGGAAFLRRAALEEVGGFDPWLFMYYEDVDVSWRLRLAGYDIRSVPDAVIVHRHAASSASSGTLVRYQSMRNRLAVVLRNGSAGLIVRVLARTVARAAIDLARPESAQLERTAWLRLLREAPGLVRHARSRRQGDGVNRAQRRVVEALLTSSSARIEQP